MTKHQEILDYLAKMEFTHLFQMAEIVTHHLIDFKVIEVKPESFSTSDGRFGVTLDELIDYVQFHDQPGFLDNKKEMDRIHRLRVIAATDLVDPPITYWVDVIQFVLKEYPDLDDRLKNAFEDWHLIASAFFADRRYERFEPMLFNKLQDALRDTIGLAFRLFEI